MFDGLQGHDPAREEPLESARRLWWAQQSQVQVEEEAENGA
jgi:hypothetical protein